MVCGAPSFCKGHTVKRLVGIEPRTCPGKISVASLDSKPSFQDGQVSSTVFRTSRLWASVVKLSEPYLPKVAAGRTE